MCLNLSIPPCILAYVLLYGEPFIWSPFLGSGGRSPLHQFIQVNGIRQNGVLGVALFAVAINDNGDELTAAVSRPLLVDDLVIWYASPSVRHMARQL